MRGEPDEVIASPIEPSAERRPTTGRQQAATAHCISATETDTSVVRAAPAPDCAGRQPVASINQHANESPSLKTRMHRKSALQPASALCPTLCIGARRDILDPP